VFSGIFRFFKELDGRIKVTVAGAGIQVWGQNLSMQYNQLYAENLGANPVSLGLLNSIGFGISSIASIPMGWAAEEYGAKKVMLLALAFAFTSATIYAVAGTWWMLVPAIILAGQARINPLADMIFVTASKTQQRSAVMSLARVIWGALTISAPMTAALIVANFGGINAQGIRPLYYVQLVLAIFVFLFIAMKLRPLLHPIDRKKDSLGSNRVGFIQDFQDLFKGEKWLKRWVALRAIRQFASSLALVFIPLWLVNVKGATPYILGTMGTVSIMTSFLLQIPVGRLADKIGRKRAFFLLYPITYLGTFLLIQAPNPEYLIVVGFLGALGLSMGTEGGGGIGGTSFIPFITMHWEMVPADKRGRWFGVDGLTMMVAVPATILGGILWQQGHMIEVLLLPVLMEALIAIPILITVPDTLSRNKS
jgi:MFS family permease